MLNKNEFIRDVSKIALKKQIEGGNLSDFDRLESLLVSPVLLPIAVMLEGVTGLDFSDPNDVIAYLEKHLDDKDQRLNLTHEYTYDLIESVKLVETGLFK